MSDVRGKITLILLLLLVGLTATAEEVIRQRGCRVGRCLAADKGTMAPVQKLRRGGQAVNPYVGERRQLVILAAFRDQAFETDSAATLAKWDKIFNEKNYHEGSFVGSIHDYFFAQSYGAFDLTFDLIYVELPDSCKKYRSTNDDENSQYMVDDIVDVLQHQNIDWSQYDWEGNGYVNQMLIVYAGKGQNGGGGSNTIWPHQWWLSLHVDLTTGDRYRGYRTVVSGDKEYIIDCYCCVQEVVNYAGIKSSFGTICHEYTHCFGFPDFYYGALLVVGEWDLMDRGNYVDAGYRPTSYSAHERMLMGWLTPTELTDATTVTGMEALSDAPQAYLIRNDGHANEYYIVENRQQRGWDASLPGSGIVVFHIEYVKDIWEGVQEFVNTGSYNRYSIFAANNKPSASFLSNLRGWAYPYQTDSMVPNDSLTNASTPAATLNHANTDGRKLMSKPLTKMAISEGLASFEFMEKPVTAIAERASTAGDDKVLYDFGSILIVRKADGTIKKVMKR